MHHLNTSVSTIRVQYGFQISILLSTPAELLTFSSLLHPATPVSSLFLACSSPSWVWHLLNPWICSWPAPYRSSCLNSNVTSSARPPLTSPYKETFFLFHLHHYSIHSTYHSLQLLFFCLFSSLLSASPQNECRDHVGLIQGFISGLSHWRALRSAGWSLYEPPAEPPPLPRSLLWEELISASMVPPLYLTHTLLTALAMLGCNCFSPCPATLLAHSSVRSGTESYLCIPKAEQWSWGRSRSSAT